MVSDYEVEYQLDKYVAGLLAEPKGQFNPKMVYWQKVFPLHILPRAKLSKDTSFPDGEQVLINFGPSKQVARNAYQQLPIEGQVAQYPPQQHAFENSAYQLVTAYNAVVRQQYGIDLYLQFAPSLTVSETLTCSPVNMALRSWYSGPTSPAVGYYPVLDRSSRTVAIGQSATNVLVDNYWADNYQGLLTAPLQPDGPLLPLLTNVSAQDASIVTVKNLPGSFIVGNGDETFLVRSSDQGIYSISETTFIDSLTSPTGFSQLSPASSFTATVRRHSPTL